MFILKWVHQIVKTFFKKFPNNVNRENISRLHPITGFDLLASLKFTQKRADQEASIYVIMLIGTIEKFLQIR